ncbi:MAG: nucleotidyltransferase family protein, partial [Bacteriovoracia bacterium]
WCFGSRARGNHREFSDLDLMVESDSDLSREIAQLKEIFEESRLPIKVDLVDLASFAHSYREGFEKDKLIFLNPS